MWYGSFGDTLVPSGTLWSFRGPYGSFGNTLMAVWGGPLQYTEGVWDVFGTRDLHTAHDMLYAIWVAQYAIHGLVRQYNIHRDPNHMIICPLSCALCICIRYLLSFILINILTLQKVLMIYEIEEERRLSDRGLCIWAFWRCGFLISYFWVCTLCIFSWEVHYVSMYICIHQTTYNNE